MTENDYNKLVDVVINLNYFYFQQHTSLVSDTDFDRMMELLKACEQQHPSWKRNDSPTDAIGCDLHDGVTTKHVHPMLSTQKTYDVDELTAWARKMNVTDFCIEWKYDGISVGLVYEDGVLTSATTRGDGETGNDVTELVRGMNGVPETIDHKGYVEVRGEVVCPYFAFARINDIYSNQRSAASGIMAQTFDNRLAVKYGLEFRAFDAFNLKPTHVENINYLRSQGFECETNRVTIDELPAMIETLAESRSSFYLPTDGLVVKLNNVSERNKKGCTKHHPKWSMAFKFETDTVETEFFGFEKKTSPSGKVTWIATFCFVFINGACITRAKVGSEECAMKLGIKPGDRIRVGLRGEVTPMVFGKAV